MKKFLLLAGVATLFAANAQAGVNQYVSGKISYDFNRAKMVWGDFDGDRGQEKINKNLFSTHVAYGVKAGYVRGELELNNSGNLKKSFSDDEGTDHLKLYKHSLMANAYFDYLTCTPWTPYVGAGLGTSYLKYSWNGGESKKTVYNLAWQVMAGIGYDINANWTLDAGYRYADYGRIRKNDGDGVTKYKVRDHEIMLGARYTF